MCFRTDFMLIVGYGSNNNAPPDQTPGPESDTIFVQGLGQDITKEKIAEYFGQIGVIKASSTIRSLKQVLSF